MKKRYNIRAGYEDYVLFTSAPPKRAEGGRFVLRECSQTELKYLHDVAGIDFIYEDEPKAENS